MHDIDPADLIRFANRWAGLGDSVAEQVQQAVDNPACGSCWNEGTEHGVNPAAIRIAQERLEGLNEALDEALADFLDSVDG